MFAFLSDFLQKKMIFDLSCIPLDACRIMRPYLLEKAEITDGTVFVFSVPYYTRACDDENRNLSAYAVSRDYHIFFHTLFDELIPLLSKRFPNARFAGFSDHSPIDEVHAAACAGLGVIGKNRLLLTEKYSSYVFLGEIITSEKLACKPNSPDTCHACGACQRACPMDGKETLCLSALTQKKGMLSESEKHALSCFESVWGCDRCQEVCPRTIRAKKNGTIYSEIPFFSASPISHLTKEGLDIMGDEEFERRAYAWRKKATIERNLQFHKKGETTCSD